jgi:uncharacterized protein (TIGR02594 family)
MVTRRMFTIGAGVMALVGNAACTTQGESRRLMLGGTGVTPFGQKFPKPDDPSWAEARALLNAAPTGVPPILVANYFLTSIPDKYKIAWPEPNPKKPTLANPLILLFFDATNDLPHQGDLTPWCAAFANWCLERAGIQGTKSSAAQSFVTSSWGTTIWTPVDGAPSHARRGDIAVFRYKSKPSTGHVGFFYDLDTTPRVLILGGNQTGGLGKNERHWISKKVLPAPANPDLELIAIQTKPGLRVNAAAS